MDSSTHNIRSLLSLKFLLRIAVVNTVDNIQDPLFRMNCPKIAFCGLTRNDFKQKPATCGFFTTGAFTANPKRMTVMLESATHSYIALYPVIVEFSKGPRCEFNHLMVRKYLINISIKIQYHISNIFWFSGIIEACIIDWVVIVAESTANLSSVCCDCRQLRTDHHHWIMLIHIRRRPRKWYYNGKIQSTDSVEGIATLISTKDHCGRHSEWYFNVHSWYAMDWNWVNCHGPNLVSWQPGTCAVWFVKLVLHGYTTWGSGC